MFSSYLMHFAILLYCPLKLQRVANSSFNYHFREFTLSNPILASTLNVISGKVTPLDLIEVVTESSVYHSFLSIGYGLIADMDIESERLRCLGGLRFALWAIIRTIGEFDPVHCFTCLNIVTFIFSILFLPHVTRHALTLCCYFSAICLLSSSQVQMYTELPAGVKQR